MDQEKTKRPFEDLDTKIEQRLAKAEESIRQKEQEKYKGIRENITAKSALKQELENLLVKAEEDYNEYQSQFLSAKEIRELLKGKLTTYNEKVLELQRQGVKDIKQVSIKDILLTAKSEEISSEEVSEEAKDFTKTSQAADYIEAKEDLLDKAHKVRATKIEMKKQFQDEKAESVIKNQGTKRKLITKKQLTNMIQVKIAEIEKQIQELEAQTPEGQAKIREEVKKNILARHESRFYPQKDQSIVLYDDLDEEPAIRKFVKDILVEVYTDKLDTSYVEERKKQEHFDYILNNLESIEAQIAKLDEAKQAILAMQQEKRNLINFLANFFSENSDQRKNIIKFFKDNRDYRMPLSLREESPTQDTIGDSPLAEIYVENLLPFGNPFGNNIDIEEELKQRIQRLDNLKYGRKMDISFPVNNTNFISIDDIICTAQNLNLFFVDSHKEIEQNKILPLAHNQCVSIYHKSFSHHSRGVSVSQETYDSLLKEGGLERVKNGLKRFEEKFVEERENLKKQLTDRINKDWAKAKMDRANERLVYFQNKNSLKLQEVLQFEQGFENYRKQIEKALLLITDFQTEHQNELENQVNVSLLSGNDYYVNFPLFQENKSLNELANKRDNLQQQIAEKQKQKPPFFSLWGKGKYEDELQELQTQYENKKGNWEESLKQYEDKRKICDSLAPLLKRILAQIGLEKSLQKQNISIKSLLEHIEKKETEKLKQLQLSSENAELYKQYQGLKQQVEEAKENYYQNQKK